MGIHQDPEGIELKSILKHIILKNKNILEIGCGDGRFTFKYTNLARQVMAIDPNKEEIEKARSNFPHEFRSKLEFRIETGEKLPFLDQSYDIVFFPFSLCCMASQEIMVLSLDEAYRVLKKDGILVNTIESLHQPFKKGIIGFLLTKHRHAFVFGDETYEKGIDARYALKYTTLIKKKFDYIKEECVTANIYYDTLEEAVEALKEQRPKKYEDLDEEKKQEIKRILNTKMTPKGIKEQTNVIITFLSKR